MRQLASVLILIIFISCAKQNPVSAQGYSIKIELRNLTDTVVYLGHHYGSKQYLIDTFKIKNNTDPILFEHVEDTLKGGMYFLVFPDKSFFEFVVPGPDNQKFTLRSDKNDIIGKMEVEGSEENEVFFNYINYLTEKKKEAFQLKSKLKKITDQEEKEEVKAKIKQLDELVTQKQEELAEEHPGALITKIVMGSKDPEVPDPPVLENGKADSAFSFRYYKAHYFDNLDFTDGRLARSPLYHQRLEKFMTRLTVKHPDSIIKAADYVVEKARQDKEMFKYTVWYITHKFERSKIMGMDKVFVHMVENYYTPELAFWADEATLYRMNEHAKTLKKLLIGKKAPPMKLKNMEGEEIGLYDINARYTVIYFWDPDCSHCKKATPKLKAMYKDLTSKGVEIYAVSTETEIKKWVDYINENDLKWINVADPQFKSTFRQDYDIESTPAIYIIDENNEIIAKKLSVEQIEEFLEQYEKNN